MSLMPSSGLYMCIHTCAQAHAAHAALVRILWDNVCFEIAPKSLVAHFLWQSRRLEELAMSRYNLSRDQADLSHFILGKKKIMQTDP